MKQIEQGVQTAPDKIVGIEAIADRVGISHTTIRKLARENRSGAPIKQEGRFWVAERPDLDRWANLKQDRMVGLPSIAAFVGVCVMTMRKMAHEKTNGIPVRMVGGRWWASRQELGDWCTKQVSQEER